MNLVDYLFVAVLKSLLTAIHKPSNTHSEAVMEPLQSRITKNVDMELLMIGSCSSTYRLGQVILKVPRIDEEAEITQGNAKATAIEADVYRMLGTHERIANCLYISPTKDMIMLEYYVHGNLKDYVATHGPTQLRRWAKQMIEAVHFVHGKGVRHSDIRLGQWLLDSEMNARLSDFNASGYDECPTFGLSKQEALGHENPSHFMPRDPAARPLIEWQAELRVATVLCATLLLSISLSNTCITEAREG